MLFRSGNDGKLHWAQLTPLRLFAADTDDGGVCGHWDSGAKAVRRQEEG